MPKGTLFGLNISKRMDGVSFLWVMLPWHIPLILAFTTFVHYLDRNMLALALPQIAQEQGWTNAQLGSYGQYLLGAFYFSFGLVQIFLSPLAERWHIKGSLLASVAGFSVVTFLFYPFGRSVLGLIALRLLLGAAESLHMPMNSAIIARTFPEKARSRANSVYVAGILLALMVGPLVLIPLMTEVGWRKAFAVLGLTGMGLSLPLVAWGIPTLPPSPRTAGPAWVWPDRTLRWYLLAGSANAFCIFGLLNWLPSYLARERGIPFGELSGPLFGIFAAGIGGLFLWAWVGDRYQNRLRLAQVGLAIAGVSVLLTAAPLSNFLLVALLMVGTFFQSSYNAQEFATLQSLYPPERSGALTGLYNGFTVLMGGVGGSFLPGLLVAWTGELHSGILSIAAAAIGVSLALRRVERLRQSITP